MSSLARSGAVLTVTSLKGPLLVDTGDISSSAQMIFAHLNLYRMDLEGCEEPFYSLINPSPGEWGLSSVYLPTLGLGGSCPRTGTRESRDKSERGPIFRVVGEIGDETGVR